jgi:hypothetical protein
MMDAKQLVRQLLRFANEFELAKGEFPDYSCVVYPPNEMHGIQGPKIKRVSFDASTMVRAAWERHEEAFWRFKELANSLFPVLPPAELVITEHSTVDGSVLFWALRNEYPPAMRVGLAPSNNPFWHVAFALRQLADKLDALTTKPKGDKSKVILPEQRNKFEVQWIADHPEFSQLRKDDKDDFLSAYNHKYPDDPQTTMKAFRNARSAVKR